VFYIYINQLQTVPVHSFVISLFVFSLYFLLVYLFEIVRPIRTILGEMKALLTGRKYKKLYTKRLDEIGVIAHFFNQVTQSFEKVTKDIKEGKRMLGELEIAGQLQQDILPKESPEVNGIEVVAKNRPAVELGGDNFDFVKSGNNTFMYIGDVTGHGVPAALVMTMANSLIHTFVDIYDNAYDVVVNANKYLKTRIKSTMFMTMLMLRWDEVNQKMTYVGCGHEHLLIYRANTGKCDSRKSGGLALGMVPDNSKLIKEEEIKLEVGDVIILYTDGLTEGRNMSGEMYTLERLITAVERFAAEYGPDGIINHVAKDYSRFVQDHVQDDDVTLMAVQYTGAAAKKGRAAELITTQWNPEETDKKVEKNEEKEKGEEKNLNDAETKYKETLSDDKPKENVKLVSEESEPKADNSGEDEESLENKE